MRKVGKPLLMGAVVALLLSPARGSAASTAVAVADFDYSDTSGEVTDQTSEHRSRMTMFATLLRENVAQHDYRVVRPSCPQPACTAISMAPADLVAAARRDGARYLVYGGIRKMSTLVQWGEVQLFDVEREQLVMRRTVTFRGDTDTAFRRAADFVGATVADAIKPPAP
ncbi:DUF3280 domain-containing protein [Rhodopseudomonas sp. P2A-2r]|uniref:DUF3280 domain-containing protein n=1 Tax=unclassified Rhodopseudomonas TaxID=2638247 RepID=UPI0022340D5E|nr:DUF3280 domain-containing protein [Rhodopseudomonas sp. P2A-2r]UZE48574.1 DUF3280 domain-containing protein [Rhodopseudomonas sp. P2A-2r]